MQQSEWRGTLGLAIKMGYNFHDPLDKLSEAALQYIEQLEEENRVLRGKNDQTNN